jgi:hypothetical protein
MHICLVKRTRPRFSQFWSYSYWLQSSVPSRGKCRLQEDSLLLKTVYRNRSQHQTGLREARKHHRSSAISRMNSRCSTFRIAKGPHRFRRMRKRPATDRRNQVIRATIPTFPVGQESCGLLTHLSWRILNQCGRTCLRVSYRTSTLVNPLCRAIET